MYIWELGRKQAPIRRGSVMSNSGIRSSSKQLLQAIEDKAIVVTSVTAQSKDFHTSLQRITSDKFTEDLEFYMLSGILADGLDIMYDLTKDGIEFSIGRMSSFFDCCIRVEGQIQKPECLEHLKKVEA